MLLMMDFWLFFGVAIRSLPLTLQRFLPCTDIVLIVITEKAPYLDISPVMLQLALFRF